MTVVARHLGPAMGAVVEEGLVEYRPRGPQPADLAGMFVVYAAGCEEDTASMLLDAAVAERALLNVHDMPRFCSFHEPAVVDRGTLKIAIGTAGASPGLAATVRRELEVRYGPEYAPYARILGAVRRWSSGAGAVERLRASRLLELVRDRRVLEIDELLGAVVGAGCTLAELGVPLDEVRPWN